MQYFTVLQVNIAQLLIGIYKVHMHCMHVECIGLDNFPINPQLQSNVNNSIVVVKTDCMVSQVWCLW